ncbi:protein prenylyltransferase superfamily protein [Artemisia annua]|uniref:Protein prenylyltransferase superfamily protein n=1 Tax=Artemisia annua TaxID=35608 RepID=A0A2U1QJH7_ARTAN|nr:protein prenylyltransferase superfamily protein [Artemisia annua]
MLAATSDEVGFVHPSQFAAMSDMSSTSTGASQVIHTDMAFWSEDHKLGISTEVIQPLYVAAKRAFMSSRDQYKVLVGENIASDSSSLNTIEYEVMKHSRAVLLLSGDFGTAWNSRRWVIKMIADKPTNMQEVLKSESELAERIAEKSKMNYRAWNHRCWLVSYMPETQVIDELVNHRDWAGLHIADNSCFHYRTRLISRTLDDSWYKQDLKASPRNSAEVCQLWKEELTWSEILIKRYIGREALWLYRRVLSMCWIKHFASRTGETHMDSFLDNELHLFRSCTTIPDNVFEDYQSQAMFAATYIMWLIKQMDKPQSMETREKVGEEVEEVLNKVCPEKAFLWDLARIKSEWLV